jgi:hypothetical protein
MSVRTEKTKEGMDLIIDGFEKGIASSPYSGIGNIRNLNTNYYPGAAYVNYRRQATTFNTSNSTLWFAGTHSVNVSNNHGWTFSAPFTPTMTNPVQHATSPLGLNYILDDTGQIWKQSAVNSSIFNYLAGGYGRVGAGNGGLAFWNNYLVVFGGGLIEFCGDGTGDAGVISANWNLSSVSSTMNVTSGIVVSSAISAPVAGGYVFNGVVHAGDTSATVTPTWKGVSGNYWVRFSNTLPDERIVTFTNGQGTVSWTGGLGTDTFSTSFYMYQLTANNGSFVGTNLFLAGQPVTFSSTGTLPTGLSALATYYLTKDIDMTGSTTFGIATTYAFAIAKQPFIALTDAGTGTISINLLPSIAPPIQNTTITGFNWGVNSSGGTGTGALTINLATNWLGASGVYDIVDSMGNHLLGLFGYLSTLVTLNNPAVIQSLGTLSVNIINPNATVGRAYVSKVDGNLYFANGRGIGRVQSSPNINLKFNPSIVASYSVSYSAINAAQPQDTVVDMVDLQKSMIFAGNFDIYVWDYNSAEPNTSYPVGEKVVRVSNLLNNIYITAGTKGNIYVSNGFSAQLLFKIPDFIAGVIDPIWSWGGIMAHRSKLWVQAMAQTSSGTNILAGIFSLLVSPGLLGEQASGLIMENQNSYGLTPATGAKQNGLLIDNENWSSGTDSYYSAWSNGATTGGIDYNDGTPWQNNEPIIETDIVPIGNYLIKKTLGSIEFKLDRPLATGDSVSLYWRPSLTDSYVAIPLVDTSANLLSNYAGTAINQAQWAQFKITFKCASSNSSFIPLKEIRLHING